MNKRVTYPKRAVESAHRKPKSTTNAGTEAGASHSEISQGAILRAWLAHHQFSCADSFGRLLASPWQSFLTWMVIAIAIVLPLALFVGLSNVQQLAKDWQGQAQVSLFLKSQARTQAIDALQTRLSKDERFKDIMLITPAQAQQEFQQLSGLGNILESLEDNPLPAVLVMTLADKQWDQAQLDSLQDSLREEVLVDVVQFDATWLKRLNAMTDVASHIVLALGGLLALGVLLVIGNTIRLEIESRRDEIVVTKMVGATDGFVRRPFLYSGFWYGLGGALLALVLLQLAQWWLTQPLQVLFNTYGSEYSLSPLGFENAIAVLCLASVLGLLGGWLAVARHLKYIEPV